VQQCVAEAYELARHNDAGETSRVYPALAGAPRHLFGIAVVGISGDRYEAGNALHPFAIMSVSKPFVFALVCESRGAERARAELGVNATGLPFDSVVAIERGPEGRTNPMVNPGAIAATSLVPGTTAEAKWRCLHEGLSAFAGRTLTVDEEIYASASTSNDRNRGIAHVLRGCGRIAFDSVETLDLYTRQCSLSVTARDLAVMGATLADGGVNPCTRERVVSAGACSRTLAVMTTAGLYETSGDWLYDIGVPGKSGIAGGIVAVAPGKGALGTFAPPLDAAGNSIKGQLTAKFLAQRLGLDIFASRPAEGSMRPV
jgi:glutaminase